VNSNIGFTEEAISFECAGERLLGVVARPHHWELADLAVLVVVGGPQVRSGSHRQFTLLGRDLAACGVPTMRFDVRGMGDSSGSLRNFTQIDADIAAAIGAFQRHCPGLRRVVLWGLCDGASASLLYLQATQDRRVAGLVLLNPWVRSAQTLARTHVKHYYWQRLRQPAFWKKLLSGGVAGQALRDLGSNLRSARAPSPGGDPAAATLSFQDRMLQGAENFNGPTLWILSGQDYTAKEFADMTATHVRWKAVLQRAGSTHFELPDADHTFSSPTDERAASQRTSTWLMQLQATNGKTAP